MTTIALVLSPQGMDCRLLVDGVDISHAVQAVEVVARVGTRTEIRVEMIGRVEVTGDVARVLALPPADTE